MGAGGFKQTTMLARFTVMDKLIYIMARSSTRFVHHFFLFLHIHRVLIDFSLTVKAATLIFISGRGSAISRKGNQVLLSIW